MTQQLLELLDGNPHLRVQERRPKVSQSMKAEGLTPARRHNPLVNFGRRM